MRNRDIFLELLDFSHIHMIIFISNPSKYTLSICLSNKTFKKSKPPTHPQTDQGLSGGGGDHCGHACKYTLLPPHTPITHTHKQTKACQEGAEIIVATPVSIHPYPHMHPSPTHTNRPKLVRRGRRLLWPCL